MSSHGRTLNEPKRQGPGDRAARVKSAPSLVPAVAVGLMLSGCQMLGFPEGPRPASYVTGRVVIVADFDQPGHQTNFGTPFGGWEHDPGDATQFCRSRLVEAQRVGPEGYGLMIDYDVESPNPAYCGFWMKLASIPVRDFHSLNFSIKGDPDKGHTTRVKLEVKDHQQVASYRLDGISPEWTRVQIPLKDFDGISRLRRLTEWVIVFEDQVVDKKLGTIYVDEVTLLQ